MQEAAQQKLIEVYKMKGVSDDKLDDMQVRRMRRLYRARSPTPVHMNPS